MSSTTLDRLVVDRRGRTGLCLRGVRGEAVVFADSPVPPAVTYQPAVLEARECGPDAPSLDTGRLVDLRLRERLIAVLGEELQDSIGLRPFPDVKALWRFFL